MSIIESKIKALQRKLVTTEMLNKVLTYVESIPEDEAHVDIVKSELAPLFKAFVESQVKKLEEGVTLGVDAPAQAQFSQEEVSLLKTLAARVKNAPAAKQEAVSPQANSPHLLNSPATPKPQAKQDQVQFALANRHLDQKRVVVTTKDGNVNGKVVGLAYPNVVVETDTGYVAQVSLEQITVLN